MSVPSTSCTGQPYPRPVPACPSRAVVRSDRWPRSADEKPSNPFQPAREKLIDRQIREAIEAGSFQNLPHQGEKLPVVDDSAAGDWALAYRMLKGASFAPSWIETDKEVRALLERRAAVLARAPRASEMARSRRAELTRIVRLANDAIFRLNHEAPTDRQHRRPLDLDAELAALDRLHGES